MIELNSESPSQHAWRKYNEAVDEARARCSLKRATMTDEEIFGPNGFKMIYDPRPVTAEDIEELKKWKGFTNVPEDNHNNEEDA